MIRRLVAGAALAVAVGLAALEVMMAPTGRDRLELGVVFAAVAAAAGAAVLVLARWTRRSRSLRTTLVATSVLTAAVVAVALVAASTRMFLSDHDLRLVLVVVIFGSVAAVLFGIDASRTLADDLERITAVADAVATGQTGRRTGVARGDEVGRLAHAVDAMSLALARAERERARDEEARRHFFAAVGHDLRSPLTSLRVALEAVADGVARDPDRYLRSMAADVAALEALVDDIFLLARIESGALTVEPVPVDVAELADETIEVLRSVAERDRVRLRLVTPDSASPGGVTPGGVVVPASPEAVGRVLRNLVDNAIRHAPADSEVVIEVREEAGATVVVRDTGAGFDPAFVPAAFTPFTRDDPARVRDGSGSGLGLAIAHGFVTALGGEIWAEPGPGGVVGFRLPRDGAAAR
ncbi:MAG: sensor histidine kinase [Actinomyces sp.]|nr:MAG: sensor histidine kinase [Actinomyces sp.]